MGGKKLVLQREADKIWQLAIELGCHIQSSHIPGIENIKVDHFSRKIDRFKHSILQKVADNIFKSDNCKIDTFTFSRMKK